MAKIVKITVKILGPKGLMPNPKLRNCNWQILQKAVKDIKIWIKLKLEMTKTETLVATIGRKSLLLTIKLLENYKAILIESIKKRKTGNQTIKGEFIKNAFS